MCAAKGMAGEDVGGTKDVPGKEQEGGKRDDQGEAEQVHAAKGLERLTKKALEKRAAAEKQALSIFYSRQGLCVVDTSPNRYAHPPRISHHCPQAVWHREAKAAPLK